MRDYERLKLQEIVMNIADDIANRQMVDNLSFIDGSEIHEPNVWISSTDYRALTKLAKLPQNLYKKTKDLPERNL